MDLFSFGELSVIVVIALIVLGPQKTFSMAFSLGKIVSKAKSSLNAIKAEINTDELKQVSSTFKENDFRCVLQNKTVSKVKKNHSSDSSKRMWTVDPSSFESKNTSSSEVELTQIQLLEKKIEKLELDLASIKEKLG